MTAKMGRSPRRKRSFIRDLASGQQRQIRDTDFFRSFLLKNGESSNPQKEGCAGAEKYDAHHSFFEMHQVNSWKHCLAEGVRAGELYPQYVGREVFTSQEGRNLRGRLEGKKSVRP